MSESIKRMYYKLYQDRNSIDANFCVLDKKQLEDELKGCIYEWNYDEDYDFPVIEPVMMTEEEVKALPEFQGF